MPAIAQTFPLYFLNQGRYRQNVINGGFDIWQRGESFIVRDAARFCADRFKAANGGGGSRLYVNKYTIPIDSVVRSKGIKHGMQLDSMTSGVDTYNPYILTIIPGAEYGAGGAVSVGMWLWADSPITLVRVGLNRNYGTGGVPSFKEPYILSTSLPLTTTPTFYEFSINLGSIEGKRFGTDGNDALELLLAFPRNTTFTVYTTGWQMNTGPRCLSFQPKTAGQELADCKRYFERINIQGKVAPIWAYGQSTSELCGTLIYATKWKTPTSITVDDVSLLEAISVGSLIPINGMTIDIFRLDENSAKLQFTTTTSFSVNNVHVVTSDAATRNYFDVDAEL